MSARVSSSAVAVIAAMGTFGKRSPRLASCAYSGRKAGPHWLMQCASSMAKSDTSSWETASSMRGVINRSGAM